MLSILNKLPNLWQSLPRVPRENRGELAISIFVAFFFWLITSLTTNSHTINKPIEVAFTVGEEEILNGPKQISVDASMKGAGWVLLWSEIFQPVVRIQLHRTLEQSKTVTLEDLIPVTRDALWYADEIEISRIGFTSIVLDTDVKEQKIVAVQPRIAIDYAKGYKAKSSLKVSPDSVVLMGSATDLAAIDSWPTDTIHITDVSENFSHTVKLATADKFTLLSKQVTLSQEVEVFTEKDIYIPVEVVNLPPQDSFSIFPQQVRLRVSVLKSNYDKINKSGFKLVADLDGLRTANGRNSIPLALVRRPKEALNVEYTPKAAEFFLFKKEAVSIATSSDHKEQANER